MQRNLKLSFALGAALLLGSLPRLILADVDDYREPAGEKLVTPRVKPQAPARPLGAAPSRIAADGDTLWVGHSVQTVNPLDHTTFNYGPYHVGVGANRPGASTGSVGNSGVWTWDNFQSDETDSLQGWHAMARQYSITGGMTLTDTQRPWWATDNGNLGNLVPNSTTSRTLGVVSYWHVDGGNHVNPGSWNGNALPAMTWAPLAGNASAWCGLRAHGDFTYGDAVTGNPFNQSVLEMVGENGTGSGTSKHYPGYPGQMDQILYRDVVIASGASLNLSFVYDTRMSRSATSTAATRTGWFQWDPTVVGNVAVPGPNNGAPNFISNTGIGQPADSFMVYIGVPVDIDNVYTADGNLHTPVLTPHGVYDLKRRWLSEVLALDMPIRQLLSVAGNTGTDNTGTFTATGVNLSAFLAAQSGTTKYLRIVFRCKTNRGFDDTFTDSGYNSGGAGAVRIDNVAIGGTGVSGAAVGTSGFETPGEIDNSDGADPAHALSAWRATGKPPAIYFHTHPLSGGSIGGGNYYSGLTYNDLCGAPGVATVRFCNMNGVVISAGDHDNGEAAGGLVVGMPERERMDGIVSPTINLCSTGPTDWNACGINSTFANPLDDYWVWYDIYTGIFDLNNQGNFWTYGVQSYPATQSNGVRCWGELRVPAATLFNPSVACLQDIEGLRSLGLIRTSNATGYPDSLRIFLGKAQECFRFGVTGPACSSTAGAYFDNVALALSNAVASNTPGAFISLDIWRWINDCFPANDGTGPSGIAPGTAQFDTAAAYIQTGINIAQSTGNTSRFDIPGDSTIIVAGGDGPCRVDMIFRVKPGVGNYVTVGNSTSGLRRIPTSTVAAANNDGSFWGTYMAHPGPYSKGVHPANGWNINTWNSARCDTADVHVFPAPATFNTISFFSGNAQWAATYHEGGDALDASGDDALKFAALGIPHPRCFLTVPTGANNSTNITCTGSPSIPANYPPSSGWNGSPVIDKEGTKIIPDGLLTPGAHVEYFFRCQDNGPPVTVAICPDTSFVSPQVVEGSTDGHRWQQFGVLPDRWKAPLFIDPSGVSGTGMACMLYVDLNDRRGNERVWVSIADSIGATASSKRGAHNGWRARGDQHYTDPATGAAIDVSGDPSIAVYTHGGQPGSTWDMYGVKAAEALTNQAGGLGSRLALQPSGLALGKGSRQGPTPLMLRTYYRVLLILTGDLNSGILGPVVNRSQDDVTLLEDYMATSDPVGTTPRAVIIAGDGFVQSEWASGGTIPAHQTLLTSYLGASIKLDAGGRPQTTYASWSGNHAQYVDLATAGPLATGGGDVYSVGNACLWGNDVLNVETNSTGAVASGYYQNFGINGPYVSGVSTPINNGTGKLYASFVDGWDIAHLFSRYGGSTIGRLAYYFKLFTSIQSAVGCQVSEPLVVLDVPGTEDGGQFVDFLRIRNNPLISGQAMVHFGLSRSDRVQVRVYDVTGRLVRTLADRTFKAGEHDVLWDGTDDEGRQVARGVYFTQVRYANTKFTDAKKLTILK